MYLLLKFENSAIAQYEKECTGGCSDAALTKWSEQLGGLAWLW